MCILVEQSEGWGEVLFICNIFFFGRDVQKAGKYLLFWLNKCANSGNIWISLRFENISTTMGLSCEKKRMMPNPTVCKS